MDGAVQTSPAFACLRQGEREGSLLDGSRVECVSAGLWGAVRVHQLRFDGIDQTESAPVNHIFGLLLSGATTCELNLDGAGWQPRRTPLQGVTVFPADVPYAVRVAQPNEILMVEVSRDFAARALEREGGAAPELQPLLGAQDAFARHLLLALAEEARNPQAHGTLKAESLATAVLAHVVDLGQRERPALPAVAALSSPRLRRVLDYIGSHLDSPLALRSLSDMVEMDMFRFTRAFKQSTGLSPHRYVLEARIHRAKELLRSTDLPITEVALQTGFSTPSHFSVTFRRLASLTPREYREGRGA